MPNALRIALLILIAAIGAFLVRILYVAASTPKTPAAAVYDRIPVAAADLPQGLLLRESDLQWRNVPHGQAPADVLIAAQNGGSGLKGALLRNRVSAGTPLRTADVIAADAPDFLAAALKPGMRAISVPIDEVSGNAGLIQPGDYVDVLLTQQLAGARDAPVAPEAAVESETIVRRVRVLAVGSALQRSKAAASEPVASARTITLEVTPHYAQVVSVATRLGTLSLALRSFATNDRSEPAAGDEQESNTPPVWAGDVSRAYRTSGTSARDTSAADSAGAHIQYSPRPVVVYRGSKVDDGETANSTGTPGLPPLPPLPSTSAGAMATADASAAMKH